MPLLSSELLDVQGLAGAYTEDAALKAYPKCETVPCDDFETSLKVPFLVLFISLSLSLSAYDALSNGFCDDLFIYFFLQAVESGLVDKAVLPIESSVAGSIYNNYDLLLHHKLHIVGEVQLLINHCLLGLTGATKENLKFVLSHPQVGYYMSVFFYLFSQPACFMLQLIGLYYGNCCTVAEFF